MDVFGCERGLYVVFKSVNVFGCERDLYMVCKLMAVFGRAFEDRLQLTFHSDNCELFRVCIV